MKTTINLGGIERPLHFGWYAFKIFEDETGLSFTKMGEIANDLKVDNLVAFIYAGILGGYHKLKMQVDFSKDDIFEWLDTYDGQITDIFDVLVYSLPKNLGENPQPRKKIR